MAMSIRRYRGQHRERICGPIRVLLAFLYIGGGSEPDARPILRDLR